MPLQLIHHRRGPADRYSWLPPFDWSIAYENERWWDEPRHYYVGQPWFVQVLGDGAEVARVELDDPGGINPEYAGVPTLGPERLEIQFIEVATASRGRRVGTEVVRALEDRHANRRLFAYSDKRTGSGHRSAGTGSITRKGRSSTARCSFSLRGRAQAAVSVTLPR